MFLGYFLSQISIIGDDDGHGHRNKNNSHNNNNNNGTRERGIVMGGKSKKMTIGMLKKHPMRILQ